MNTYRLQVRAMCPMHAELIDVYDVTLRTSATLPVETILNFIKRFETKQIFQEALTLEIAVGLGVHVETIGIHSGVEVRCTAP